MGISRYFEDAVSKGTYELLPGCASIVLERVAGIQAFVNSVVAGDDGLDDAMTGVYTAVAALTQWADAVILTGEQCSWSPKCESIKVSIHTVSICPWIQ